MAKRTSENSNMEADPTNIPPGGGGLAHPVRHDGGRTATAWQWQGNQPDSNMEYDHALLADFARRTLRNLEHIRSIEQLERRQGVPVSDLSAYPVTQQLNSLLGLVVFPKEQYSNAIPDRNLTDLVAEGWPEPDIKPRSRTCSRGADHNHRDCTTLRELIRVIRNGVAHFNIEFEAAKTAGGTREIIAVAISNRCDRCNQVTITVKLSVEGVGEIAERYAKLIIGHAQGR